MTLQKNPFVHRETKRGRHFAERRKKWRLTTQDTNNLYNTKNGLQRWAYWKWQMSPIYKFYFLAKQTLVYYNYTALLLLHTMFMITIHVSGYQS